MGFRVDAWVLEWMCSFMAVGAGMVVWIQGCVLAP